MGQIPKNVQAVILHMNTPAYDFDRAVRHLGIEELRLLLSELACMRQAHPTAGLNGGGRNRQPDRDTTALLLTSPTRGRRSRDQTVIPSDG